jgi:hypothetical protein
MVNTSELPILVDMLAGIFFDDFGAPYRCCLRPGMVAMA